MINGIKSLNGGRLFKIAQYRNRAEELRTIADDLIQESEQNTLRSIAETYDRLADDAVAMAEIWL